MIIIGCDYHPAFEQIALVDTETGDCAERRLEHRETVEKFYRDLAAQEKRFVWGWKQAGMRAGLNDYPQNCSLSCGSGTQPRSTRGGYASRRRIARMRS